MRRIGDYELVEKIGAGGMGEVWRGENVHTKLRCAVKLLPQEATRDKNFVARFFDEGRVMAELDHPRIVRVHHVGYDEALGRYFLVMDYIEGPQGRPQSLQGALEQSPQSRLPEAQVHRWAVQIAEGLAYAHGRGVVHRDIKPANILIDKEGDVRITDYGLAKVVGHDFVMGQIHQSIQQSMRGTLSDTPTLRAVLQHGDHAEATLSDQETIAREEGGSSHRTSAESLLGTYDYMSPEQRGELHGIEAGPASDIYSFGVMLYRILTGRRPTGRVKRVSQVVRGLSRHWDVIADRCLEHQPSDRYADGGELLAAIRKAGRGGPLGRLAQAAICVIVLVGIAAGGYEVWTWYQGRGHQAQEVNQPADESTAQRQAEIATLFRQAKSQYESGQFAQALVTLGRLEALTPPDANSVSLRAQIEQGMRVPPGGQPAVVAAKIPCRIKVNPPEATVTLTDDRQQLVTEKQAGPQGLAIELAQGTYHAMVTCNGYQTAIQDLKVSEDRNSWEIALSQRLGKLLVVSNPGVTVTATGVNANDLLLGTTDPQGQLQVDALREGKYTLSLSLADYQPKTVSVTLAEGQPAEVRQPLDPLPGRFKVGGRSDLEIYEAGRKLGKANEWIEVPAGEHELEYRCKGFRTVKATVTIPPNRQVPKAEPVLVAESGTIRITAVSALPADNYLATQKPQVRTDGGPWREVSLPYVEQGLSCESHTVELKLAGYQPVQAKQATVRDGLPSPVEFSLTPMPGSAIVACNTSGAEVFDSAGRRLGAAGERLTLAAFASHELRVKAPRHKDGGVTVRIDRPGMDTGSQRVTLEEIHIVVVGEPWTVPDVNMAFVYVKPGSIQVANPAPGGRPRTIQADRGYWIAAREVTNAQYERFVQESGYDGRREGGSDYLRHQRDRSQAIFADDQRPVVCVSWNNAAAFCRWLTERERAAGRLPQGCLYALPTEAEWEYAARGGTSSRQFTYAGGNAPDDVAWHAANSGGVTQVPGKKTPNEIGIFDMSGNVSEWCHDWYMPDDSGQNPSGSSPNPGCVVRGGSWQDPPDRCRCSSRACAEPGLAHMARGFRVVLVTQERPPRTVPRVTPTQPQRKKENERPARRSIPIL